MTQLSPHPRSKQGWGWQLYEFDRPVAPWLKTKAEADEDAIKTGRGDRSAWQTDGLPLCVCADRALPEAQTKNQKRLGREARAKKAPTYTGVDS